MHSDVFTVKLLYCYNSLYRWSDAFIYSLHARFNGAAVAEFIKKQACGRRVVGSNPRSFIFIVFFFFSIDVSFWTSFDHISADVFNQIDVE